jgi:hypothetical protein
MENIGNALIAAQEILKGMLSQGLGDAKHVYGATKAISLEFGLSMEDALIVMENALKLV